MLNEVELMDTLLARLQYQQTNPSSSDPCFETIKSDWQIESR